MARGEAATSGLEVMEETLLIPIKAGLIGADIQASLTPAMHMNEGMAQGISYGYELMDLNQMDASVDDLPRLLFEAEKRGFSGLNITHPCKQAIVPHLDALSVEAKSIGAVNTVILKGGRRYGHNTDWWGFAESFRRGFPGVDTSFVVQIGAGGAGVATAYAALSLGVPQLAVFDREPQRAIALCRSMQQIFPDAHVSAEKTLSQAMQQASGLIHATPTGMANYPGLPLPAYMLSQHHWVAEIVYFPLETELLKQARQCGCKTLDGGGMAVFQAVGSFRLITGLEPDANRMLNDFKEMTR